MWSDAVIDNIARKVAEESMEDELDKWMVGESEHGHMPLVKKPQHVIDEERADMMKERRKELAQMEMFDDSYLNWKGHR
jgi:hypothetical protein